MYRIHPGAQQSSYQIFYMRNDLGYQKRLGTCRTHLKFRRSVFGHLQYCTIEMNVFHLGRENKSTCALVTLSNWDWFSKWSDAPLKKRGDEYDEMKKTIGEKCIQRACELYPQIKDHIDFVEIG